MKVIEMAQVEAQAWRNGGGVTRELLAWPDADDWALRLSVADIERDGPFSAFGGIDRVFAVLTGAGVRLDWPGRSVTLDADSPSLAFDGGDPPHAALVGGATRDLNLMLRRERARGRLARARPGSAWSGDAPWRGLLTPAAAQLAIDGAMPITLPAWSLVFSTTAAGQHWRLGAEPGATVYWIEATPR